MGKLWRSARNDAVSYRASSQALLSKVKENMADQGKRQGLFVNVKQTTKERLDSFKQEYPAYTQGSIIEKLLDNFASLSEAEQKEMLERGASDTFKEIGDLLAFNLWANNSFNLGVQGNKGAWISALEYYLELERVASRLERLRNFCIYRQGYILAEIGECIRLEAIQSMHKKDDSFVDQCYDLARSALNKAISCYTRLQRDIEASGVVEKRSPVYPTLFYNSACARSQIAQFLAERELMRPIQRGEKMAARLKIIQEWLAKLPDEKFAEIAWQKIGPTWRSFVHPGIKKEIDQLAGQAMKDLRQVQGASDDPLHLKRVLEYTAQDQDLIFLRTDQDWRKALEDFLATTTQDTITGHFASAYRRFYPND